MQRAYLILLLAASAVCLATAQSDTDAQWVHKNRCTKSGACRISTLYKPVWPQPHDKSHAGCALACRARKMPNSRPLAAIEPSLAFASSGAYWKSITNAARCVGPSRL
jgi:hypothetical protein